MNTAKEINLEEMWGKFDSIRAWDMNEEMAFKSVLREACEKVLDLAADRARVKYVSRLRAEVDKESILEIKKEF